VVDLIAAGVHWMQNDFRFLQQVGYVCRSRVFSVGGALAGTGGAVGRRAARGWRGWRRRSCPSGTASSPPSGTSATWPPPRATRRTGPMTGFLRNRCGRKARRPSNPLSPLLPKGLAVATRVPLTLIARTRAPTTTPPSPTGSRGGPRPRAPAGQPAPPRVPHRGPPPPPRRLPRGLLLRPQRHQRPRPPSRPPTPSRRHPAGVRRALMDPFPRRGVTDWSDGSDDPFPIVDRIRGPMGMRNVLCSNRVSTGSFLLILSTVPISSNNRFGPF